MPTPLILRCADLLCEPEPELGGRTAGLWLGWSGKATLRDDILRTTLTSSLRRLVVYTTPARDTLAMNMVAQSGGDAQELGVCVPQPGQTFTCDMRIAVERA